MTETDEIADLLFLFVPHKGCLVQSIPGQFQHKKHFGFMSCRTNRKPGLRSWRKFIYTCSSLSINLRVFERKEEVELIREVYRTNELSSGNPILHSHVLVRRKCFG